MKQRPFAIPMGLTMMFCASIAYGQSSSPAVTLEQSHEDAVNPNRFGLSYRMGLNISARFKGLGGYQPLEGQNLRTAEGDLYNYDDGYNLPDSIPGHNIGGVPVTTYWGYIDSQQRIDDSAIVMHRSSSAAGASTDDIYNDPQHGLELSYNRLLKRTDKVRWGLEAAFGYTYLSFDDNSGLNGDVMRTSTVFGFGGISLPPAGYTGPEEVAPGYPALNSVGEETSQTLPGAALITGTRNLKANVYGLRLGPSAEVDLGKGFAASLSGGLAVVGVYSDFSYQESVAIPDADVQDLYHSVNHSGSSSKSDWLVGGYVGANLSYTVSKSIGVAAGVQYQNVGKYTHAIGGKEAELNLGKSIFVTLGINYSF